MAESTDEAQWVKYEVQRDGLRAGVVTLMLKCEALKVLGILVERNLLSGTPESYYLRIVKDVVEVRTMSSGELLLSLIKT